MAAKFRNGSKNGRYLGQCPYLPAGQLDPDERTRDDAGAIWLCTAEVWQRSWAVIAFPYMHACTRACARPPPGPAGVCIRKS